MKKTTPNQRKQVYEALEDAQANMSQAVPSHHTETCCRQKGHTGFCVLLVKFN